jgi:hypothetical protein
MTKDGRRMTNLPVRFLVRPTSAKVTDIFLFSQSQIAPSLYMCTNFPPDTCTGLKTRHLYQPKT